MSNKAFNPNGAIPDNGNYFGIPILPEDGALVLISAPWDLNHRGRNRSSYAPDAIIEASRTVDFHEPMAPDSWRKGIATAPIDYTLQDLSHHLRSDAERMVKVFDGNGITPFDNLGYERSARRVNDGYVTLNNNIYTQSRNWLAQGKIVGLVGGDQSAAYGHIRAMGEYHKEIGILHIDSSCNLKRCHQGFEYSSKSVMYNVLRDIPQVKRLVSLGVRAFSPEEWTMAEADSRIKLFTGQEIWSRHFEGTLWSTIVKEIIDELPDNVYVSLDINGLTVECSPHTGMVVAGGIRFPEVIYLLGKIVDSGRRIVGFDLSEVVPDMDDKTDATIAARLLYNICSMALKNHDVPYIL